MPPLLQKDGRFGKRGGTFAQGRALLQKRGLFCRRGGVFAKEPYENRPHFQKRLGNSEITHVCLLQHMYPYTDIDIDTEIYPDTDIYPYADIDIDTDVCLLQNNTRVPSMGWQQLVGSFKF